MTAIVQPLLAGGQGLGMNSVMTVGTTGTYTTTQYTPNPYYPPYPPPSIPVYTTHIFNGYEESDFGALSITDFMDATFTLRTVWSAVWQNSEGGAPQVIFYLTGTSISNSDSTFTSVTFNGTTKTRSSGSYFANDGSGHTAWAWAQASDPFPAVPNTCPFVVTV